MRILTSSFLLATVLMAGTTMSSAALAGEGCGGGALATVQHIFDVADTDGDGFLTATEYDTAGLQTYGVGFAESDANGDGRTSLDEYLTLYEKHHPPGGRGEA